LNERKGGIESTDCTKINASARQQRMGTRLCKRRMNEWKEKGTERKKEKEVKKPFAFEKLMGSPYTVHMDCGFLLPGITILVFKN
jgi:hypothetical protein